MLPSSRGPSSRRVSRSTRPTPGQPLVAELVAVAEQLQAAADGEHDGAAAGRGVQRVALDRGEVARAQRLVAVLPAADVEEVVRLGIDRVADAGAGQLEADARARRSGARTRSGCRGRRRCSSGRDRARRRAASAQARSSTTSAPTWSAVAATRRAGSGCRPAARPSASSCSTLDVRELDRVVLLAVAPPSGANGAAHALDPRRRRQRAHGGRLGREAPAADGADVGAREQLVVELAEVLERGGDRDREQPARREVAARRGEEAGALGQQLDRLHRHDHEPEAALQRERGRVGDRRSRRAGRPRGATQRVEQLGLAVQRRHGVARRGRGRARRARCPRRRRAPARPRRARARARAAGRRGSRRTRRRARRRAARTCARAHRQCPCTWPRRASRSRSSSSAV